MKVYLLQDMYRITRRVYEKEADARNANLTSAYIEPFDVVPASPDLKLWSLWLEWNGQIVERPTLAYDRARESVKIYSCNPNVVIFYVRATDSADALTVARRRLNVALDGAADMFEEGKE